jgi:hypothetical protein
VKNYLTLDIPTTGFARISVFGNIGYEKKGRILKGQKVMKDIQKRSAKSAGRFLNLLLRQIPRVLPNARLSTKG